MECSFRLSEKKMSFYLLQIKKYNITTEFKEKNKELYMFKVEDQLIPTHTEFCLIWVSNKIELNILWYLSLSFIWIEK